MKIDVPTPAGRGRLTVDSAERPTAVLWLGHGAGGGIDAIDLAALAAGLPGRGITVIRYEQPWRVAGRPATLDAAWCETAPVVAELTAGAPLVVGGRSAGARVACRTAGTTSAAAVVCLAFPLHPPGRPEVSRLDELLSPEVPVLALQGGRDAFRQCGHPDRRARSARAHPSRRGSRSRPPDAGTRRLPAPCRRRRRPRGGGGRRFRRRTGLSGPVR